MSWRIPPGTNLGGITPYLHNLGVFQILPLLIKGAGGGARGQEWLALLAPRKPIPEQTFCVDDQEHDSDTALPSV
jgi:hypothetical protein